MAPTITGFKALNFFIQYLATNTHKQIFYPYNSYEKLNIIRLTWSVNIVEVHNPTFSIISSGYRPSQDSK